MAKSLSHYLYAPEEQSVQNLLKHLSWDENRAANVQALAGGLVEDARAQKRPVAQLETFLQDYSLDTAEGLSLMCLAEALLRIPDKDTANALIKDRVVAANWLESAGDSQNWIVKAAGVGLLMTQKTLESALARIGEPLIREAMISAMHIMGQQFVLGEDIEDAVKNAQKYSKKNYRISYDMLGEGARTKIDAEKYYESYSRAITYVGKTSNQNGDGISIKLSALHPRYQFSQADQCVPELVEKVSALAHKALAHNIPFVIDAEEVDRLEISLQIIDQILAQNNFGNWDGFGLAVQAYQKRAYPLIEKLCAMARNYKTRLRIRLVKGAYWDSEIKRAQILGLQDYPVFTRKANTDVSYLACAEYMLSQKGAIYPMFATHNAHTIAAILDIAHERAADSIIGPRFEFQRLHGMGEALYNALLASQNVCVSLYAPVGPQEDLLAYLVRRLLENGANSSFVNRLMRPDETVGALIEDPVQKARTQNSIRHPHIPMPLNLYQAEKPHGRRNSKGLDLSDAQTLKDIQKSVYAQKITADARSIINGKKEKGGVLYENKNPADHGDHIGFVWPLQTSRIDFAFLKAQEGFEKWSKTDADFRARILEKASDMLEDQMYEIMAVCIREAGKTIPDALAEIREAVDFLRYYAHHGKVDFSHEGLKLPGPTGESNILKLQGRGVFVCISPWNFPLAIFIGQIAAALMAGNTVIAKPAEQTPLIAALAVQMLHKAGVPKDVLHLALGDGELGAALITHKFVAGVAFTGSGQAAQSINRTLAAKSGPIVPLIAETGGQNVMIVDSSALPEQVVDDVITSAFGSAGQRCSALRILCLQDTIADKVLRLLKGAMAEIRVGDPSQITTDIGPIIDEPALANLMRHRRNIEGFGRLIFEVPVPTDVKLKGHYFAPCAFEIESVDILEREVFGPFLHVMRFKRDEINELIESINNLGYGLTFGVHSRIDSFQKNLAKRINAGNVYINRSMIGAVVGVQPFGGMGLSGTGPKAGGPNYLRAFAHEKVISVNTAAAGGNTSLVTLEE